MHHEPQTPLVRRVFGIILPVLLWGFFDTRLLGYSRSVLLRVSIGSPILKIMHFLSFLNGLPLLILLSTSSLVHCFSVMSSSLTFSQHLNDSSLCLISVKSDLSLLGLCLKCSSTMAIIHWCTIGDHRICFHVYVRESGTVIKGAHHTFSYCHGTTTRLVLSLCTWSVWKMVISHSKRTIDQSPSRTTGQICVDPTCDTTDGSPTTKWSQDKSHVTSSKSRRSWNCYALSTIQWQLQCITESGCPLMKNDQVRQQARVCLLTTVEDQLTAKIKIQQKRGKEATARANNLKNNLPPPRESHGHGQREGIV